MLSRLTDADAISGQVAELVLNRSAHRDVQRAVLEAHNLGGSPGVLGADASSGGLVFHERSEEQRHFVRERTAAVEAMAWVAGCSSSRRASRGG
ncbi:hypothetical protein [Amycolatopsis sp.]|uniref:hypothetical protein n=1 Tax=Amycolatopsis sp. TaxID=37632 RepID=UPI0039C85BE2